MNKVKVYKKAGRLILFLTLNLCFSAAVIWIAYQNRTRIKRMIDHENSFNPEDKVILYDIFSSPLAENTQDLIFPAVTSNEEMVQQLYQLTLPDTLDLMRMYDSCRVLSVNKYREKILKIQYQLLSDTLVAYAYVNKTALRGSKTSRAVLYIPGSGDNRSGKVATRSLEMEDPTFQANEIGADIYFPIFPANDIRAVHDGIKTLDTRKIMPFLVSNNRNLSLRFLADIFALKRYLDQLYTVHHTWGHSRGGLTAAVVSSVYLPDTLIVSSGYSVYSDKFFRLGLDQLWWSRSNQYIDKNFIKSRLKNAKTKAYFLFGNKEKDDIYGLEGKYLYTEKFFKDCPNVNVRYADKKHLWFGSEISKILSGH